MTKEQWQSVQKDPQRLKELRQGEVSGGSLDPNAQIQHREETTRDRLRRAGYTEEQIKRAMD